MNEPVQRTTVRLTEAAILTAQPELSDDLLEILQPIHFAGAAVHIQNQGTTPTVFFVEDSTNGTTWSPLLVSTHTTAGNLSIPVTEHGQAGIFFVTSARYVRFRVAPACPAGVICVVSQFPPRGRDLVEVY